MDFKHYDFTRIQEKRNAQREKDKVYRTGDDPVKPKCFVLDMFPYPSGYGLHVGHPLGYIGSDIYARQKRMMGYNVLHPMGFDSFGLPAEQHAINTNTHPATSTAHSVAYYKTQLTNLGLSYDRDREIATHTPEYYKRTQAMFLKMFDHYYNNAQCKAMPIDDLIHEFEINGNSSVQAAHSQKEIFTATQWQVFSPKEKNDILMNYRIAYRKKSLVNRCEELGTVLANDEVINGVSERGGHPVELREVEQWSLRITAYKDRLLNDLDELERSSSLKMMQKNRIGESKGAQVEFEIIGSDTKLTVFTTRAETIFGVSFLVVSPETYKELVESGSVISSAEVESYIEAGKNKSELERKVGDKAMTGVLTGWYVIHPFTRIPLPVWVSDYVLGGYGTGIIMGVPSEDDRDERFANAFNLPIIEIIHTTEDGKEILMNSDMLNGLDVEVAREKIVQLLVGEGKGEGKVFYKLRDANFSRQRYRGEPIPIEYDEEGVAYALAEIELPLLLPHLENFALRSGMSSPLTQLTDRVNHNGRKRETDTMPGYAGSSRYYLRFMDPRNADQFVSPEAVNYWKDVDMYIGGTEHAVGHLLYARFWNKFLYDLGYTPSKEPFKKLFNQGMIQGVIEYIYVEKNLIAGKQRAVSANLVNEANETNYNKIAIHIKYVKDYGKEGSYLDLESIQGLRDWKSEYKNMEFVGENGKSLGEGEKFITKSESGKMGKRYHNVINPDDVIAEHGADCLRLYEMFLGPLDQSSTWSTQSISGASKFLQKFWKLYVDESGVIALETGEPSEEEKVIINTCITNIKKDSDVLAFNTCVSQFMKTVNSLREVRCKNKQILEKLLLLIAPFAPYIAEELRAVSGYTSSIHLEQFPSLYEVSSTTTEFNYPVSFNGKKKGDIKLPLGLSDEEVKQACLADPQLAKQFEGKEVANVIIVKGKIINFVLK